MFYVYKKKWSEYGEHRGVIVVAKDWQRAKGIAMTQLYWKDEIKSNIFVEEIEPIQEGIICWTNHIRNDTTCN